MTALALMTDDEVARFGRRPDAGCGALETDLGMLPLIALAVRAQVTGVVAATEVVQTFANTTGVAIEATYIFPLPDRAAVHRFRMEVGGRVVEGIVEERGLAREQYDQAIAAGHRAAIAEEERSGVFTLRVGNVMPGERATVTLALVGPLPVDDGEVTFQFPLVVAPRYIPGAALGGEQAGLGAADDTDLVPDASRISPPVRLPGMASPVRLSLEVAFDAPARDLASSLHAIVDDHGRNAIRVQPGERLDRDFILRWRVDEQELASSLVCADDADGRAGTFMLTLVPPSTRSVAQKPRDVVFVLDRSGSMEGWKMVAARRAVARMIDTLTSRDRFCAIAFDDQIAAWPERQLAAATDRTRFGTVEWLAKIDARGGTELQAPLALAASMLTGGYDDRERVIVLVTDGQVGNEDHVLRELAPALKNVRMFTLGIDQAVNAGFLRRLAAAGAGLCELVESEDRLDAVMAKVHHRIGAPIASELTLRSAGLELDRTTLAPSRLPDVYAGAPVVVLGRYIGSAPAGAAVELVGTSLGEPFHANVARHADRAASWLGVTWLGASWARARIRDLEDRYAIGEAAREPEIVAVSKRYSVLSRFTAFVAIDRADVANPGGRVMAVMQTVEQPAGWKGTRAGGPGGQHANAQMPMAMPSRSPMPFAQPPAPPLTVPLPPRPAPMPITAAATMPMSKSIAHSMAPQSMPPSPPRGVIVGAAPPPPREHKTSESISPAPYLATLAELAAELARATTPTALRVIRQRLAEWVEDVRSVGGLDELAGDVDHRVRRLLATLDVDTARAVAVELAAIAKGDDGGAPKRSRLAFWK